VLPNGNTKPDILISILFKGLISSESPFHLMATYFICGVKNNSAIFDGVFLKGIQDLFLTLISINNTNKI